MNYFGIIEATFSTSTQDDIGILLLLATPVLLLIALILFIVGIAKKEEKAKMYKKAVITFIAAGITALVGLGSCGWF